VGQEEPVTFQHPQLLWLLLLPPLLALLRRRRHATAIPFPGSTAFRAIPASPAARVASAIPSLLFISLLLSVTALAGPQLRHTRSTVVSKGVDIAIALDLSTSMLAVDGDAGKKRNRLTVAKEVLRSFIEQRGGDRIALVAFGARAYPVAPLTLDHSWLASAIDGLDTGSVDEGTAIGDGILAAVNRLRSSPAASRTVIVLTDGRSNAGAAPPALAASAAAALGVKVHCIGIGGKGVATFPVEDPLGGVSWRRVEADLDEATLRQVASTTRGQYFRAGNAEALRSVFAEIDRLEKSKIEEKRSVTRKELFPYLLLPALLLMMSAQALSWNRLRRLP
jgi:Ca-activated chloride channel homolog